MPQPRRVSRRLLWSLISVGVLVLSSASQVGGNLGQGRLVDQKLYDAIAKSDVAKVKRLLDQGADPNANQANGWRPLISLDTASPHCVEIARLLVARGAKVNYRQPGQGWTPLTNATSNVNVELIRFLLSKGADVNLGMQDRETPLLLAVRSSSAAAVRELLKAGANVKSRSIEDPASVHDARADAQVAGAFEPGFRMSGVSVATELEFHWNAQIAEILSVAGADLKATDDNGWTALHYAAQSGSVEGINGLLKYGLNPNAASNAGFAPLHVAMRSGFGFPNMPIVDALLAAGANPKAKNRRGQTPADLLRADVAQHLGTMLTSPRELVKDESIRQYLKIANDVAQRLEPGSPEISAPEPAKVHGAPAYPPLTIDLDPNVIKFERTMNVVDGKTLLTLRPESPIPAGVKLRFTQIQLNNYESSTPLPQVADAVKGFSFRFPSQAASEGCALRYAYELAGPKSSGGGTDNEGWYPNLVFQQYMIEEGVQVSIKCDLRDRPLQVRLDSVTVNGKPQKRLDGKILMVEGSKPTNVGVFPKGASVRLNYSYRLVPNLHWETGSMDLSK